MSYGTKISVMMLGVVLFVVAVLILGARAKANDDKRWAEYAMENNCRVTGTHYYASAPVMVMVGKVLVPVEQPPHKVTDYECDDGKTWER